jgi:hypothetical protein
MKTTYQQQDVDECCLFVDSSKLSLKAFLLNNGNKYPSVPVSHGRFILQNAPCCETYSRMNILSISAKT